jgi:hydrogenase-4 component B
MMAMSEHRPDLAVLGVVASLYHVMNHAVFKGLLFLGAGGVVMATGTRQIEDMGGLLRRMPWTGACFLVGALAISGFPPLNGFASEWLTFQALLNSFHGLSSPVALVLFPVTGAVLALTTALAAACFVKAFGLTFLALPRSDAAAAARESPAVMLVPQLWLAVCCLVLGLLPGFVVSRLTAVVAAPLGASQATSLAQGATGIAPGVGTFDALTPVVVGGALLLALGGAWVLRGWRRRAVVRVVPTWGCGGALSRETEYTATAFSKPIMMIFAAVYRPTRTVDALGGGSAYFPRAVRYRAHIEPTFERYLYDPLARAVLRFAERLKVLQAGSLHAYLAYVIVLVLTLMLLVWWSA